MRLTFCLCHMVYKTTRKEYGILQTRHPDVCLDKADGVCRREVGTARLPAITLPCLDWLSIYIHIYIAIRIILYLYCYITILMYWRIAILFHFCIIVYLHSLIYIYMDIQEYQHIYIGIVPFRQFSPCTSLLCIPQTRRNSPGAKLLFTPEQQGRKVEHSSGALRTTPHTTDAAHFPGCHQKVRLVLFLRSWTLHELHWENEAYFLTLPHGL